ncbi:AAA ATPase domain-containing protein [Micromonospora viridifaciens]|uniref:AAA ATPase domain-containing protein n=1 Tax=Micromonospora viridifaciens TaxID=1881 RepID=A0A1C4WC46_MICVI|nr:LuxR family transcriptional regulator [Micromonospora viridifaciens]SCE93744.1 AAA ATPase domain-containing protein [Micromonospora viridifaciens]
MPLHRGDRYWSDWPLVGRAEEVQDIVRNLTIGTGAGVLLVGEPGVGKSRLAGAILDACERDGCLVLRVTATAGWQNVPFGAVVDLLPGLLADMTDLFREVRQRLVRAAAGRPIIVGIDDANWLDEACAVLLERLLVTGVVNVLATVRGSAINAASVVALRRAGQLNRVDVPPLHRPDLIALANAALGPLDGLAQDTLWRITLGNPLFLRELLRMGRTAGTLSCQGGVWSWRQDQAAGLRLDDLIALTVGVLSEAEFTALAYVAYAEPLPLPEFGRLVPEAVAERLEERTLIQIAGTGPAAGVRLAHPLYGEAVRGRTSRLRRARILRDLVEVMAPASAGVEDRMRIVSWRCDAGLDVAPADLLAAAETALLRGGTSLAERLARQIPGPEGVWQLGRVLVGQGWSDEADRALATAYAQLPDVTERARAAALRALNLFWGIRQPQAALDLLAEARRALPDEACPELLVAEAVIAAFWGGGTAALASVAAAARQPPGDPLLATVLAPLRPYLLVNGGAPALAAAEFASGDLPIPRMWPAATQACHVHALLMCGRLDEATAVAERYYRDAVEYGSPDSVGLLAMMIGVCHGNRGQVVEAARWTKEALAVTDKQTLFPVRANILGAAAWWSAHLREFDHAREALREVREMLPAGSRSGDYALLAEALLLAMSGQRVQAGKLLRELAEEFLANGVLTWATAALHLLSRLEPGPAVTAEIRRVAELSDSPLFAWHADYAQALAEADAGLLEKLSHEWEARGYVALAMEAAMHAELAARAAGRVGRLGQRIADLRRRCPGFWPTWLAEPEQTVLLTRREREVCELATTGLSNADIAERLVLSVRTVENHLQRAYEKLGVRQRSDLPRVLCLS